MEINENVPQLCLTCMETQDEEARIADEYIKMGFEVVSYEDLTPDRDIVFWNVLETLASDWADKLQKVLYEHKNVGTVSPLYESGLIAQNAKMDILNNLTPDGAADILQACTPKEFPEVEHNDFSCVLIRKELLQEIGIPDRELLRNPLKALQWFERASQFGWIHKVCTNVLVRDVGLKDEGCCSFSHYGKHLIDELIENIITFDRLHLGNGRKCILHYLLADFQEGRRNNVGGTQFHVADLVECQRFAYNVFVLARDGEYLRLTEYVDNEQHEFDFWVGDIPDNIRFFDKRFNEICQTILKCFGIDLIHIHHTLWMTLDIFYVAGKLGIPVVLSIHDYHFTCPVLKMINPRGDLCDKNSCQRDCNECLSDNKGINDGISYMEKCRKEYRKVLQLSSKVIFPSFNALKVVAQYYEDINGKSAVVGHGIKLPDTRNNFIYGHKKKHIAFIGGISDIKGGPVIYALITHNPTKYEWYLMGGIGYVPLYHLKQQNLHKTGWYKRYEIYDLLCKYEIDIVCILSTVAETFCYTLSEAVAAGIPVVATDVGALGSRLREMGCGWIIPRDADASEIEGVFHEIDCRPELFKEKKDTTLAVKIKDLSTMEKEYEAIYGDCMSGLDKRVPVAIGQIMPFEHCVKGGDPDEDRNACSTSEQSVYLEGLEQETVSLRARLYELENSPIVRVALKIRRIRFPGKNILKRLYKYVKR